MAEIVRMPKLSDTMTEGVVSKWHKKIGDTVKSGDLLADIETDKATMEFESFQDGVLLHIGVKEGAAAPVDEILAILGEKGEDVKALLAEEESTKKANEVEEKKEESSPEPAPKIEEETKVKTPSAEKPETKASNTPATNSTSIRVSPLAKKIAAEKGINLSNIIGTGTGGRIVKRDLDAIQVGVDINYVSSESFKEEPVSQMRKTIANRLSESKFSAPHFYLTMEISMDDLIKERASINTIASTKISFNDLVIKAAGMSLRDHPQVNAAWMGDKIRYNKHINIGVAIAVDEGLLVPVVRYADGKTLSQISTEVKEFSEKAKDKKLQPQDWEGNTFTISNLGMYGIEEFTAIINSPDACILAVGGIKQTPVVKNGKVVAGNVMKVTLSCDHRVVDGATGADFLKTLKRNLENPILMLGANAI